MHECVRAAVHVCTCSGVHLRMRLPMSSRVFLSLLMKYGNTGMAVEGTVLQIAQYSSLGSFVVALCAVLLSPFAVLPTGAQDDD